MDVLASYSKDLIALSSQPEQINQNFSKPALYQSTRSQPGKRPFASSGSVGKEVIAQPVAPFLSTEEMEDRFKGYPKAPAATVEIAERCKFDLPIGGSQMPTVPLLPEDMTASQHIREKPYHGAIKLYGEIIPAIQARLDHELEIIARMGFEPIFLTVADVLNFARNTGVPFSSRGSPASSLAANVILYILVRMFP